MGYAETFKALSDPVRRDILIMLKEGKMSAGEIAKNFEMTGATVSYHLSQLKKAGLIYESKYKNYIYYELNVSVFEELMLWISQFNGGNKNE
ncbi:autorepressor SdpR family transcription factor [Robinsoniella peoriensis]|uniref:Transcriptional repressor SdpR n=1 Tax=Robinsoniella peoriensis TaxID=180332 RepID=A0A4V6HRQ8_9FIRM|nr:autorepressor SdpR family transcription factor [Robinsoniella peoriensis]TLD00038.1 Transcriptional repressor SdpR [Robinsoniella peoriensis]